MNKCRTAIDANVLIAAWAGNNTLSKKALTILNDPTRTLIVSDALWLEVMPKSLYFSRKEELAFYEAVFAKAEYAVWSQDVIDIAKHLARTYGLAAMDAMHIALAINAHAHEFVSGEKPGKPMYRVKEIAVKSFKLNLMPILR